MTTLTVGTVPYTVLHQGEPPPPAPEPPLSSWQRCVWCGERTQPNRLLCPVCASLPRR